VKGEGGEALQAVTNCCIGRGTLKPVPTGRHRVTFVDARAGKGVCISVKADACEEVDRYGWTSERFRPSGRRGAIVDFSELEDATFLEIQPMAVEEVKALMERYPRAAGSGGMSPETGMADLRNRAHAIVEIEEGGNLKRYFLLGIGLIVLSGRAMIADPLDEVPRDHRAYQAIRLFYRRGLVQALPRGVLNGTRPLTRYEMAVLLSGIVRQVKARMKKAMEQVPRKETPARGTEEPSGIGQEDLAALRSLQAEFSKDLDSPEKKKEEAISFKDLERQVKQHTLRGYMQVRALSDQSSQRADSLSDLWSSEGARNNRNRDTFFIRRARIQLGGKLTDQAGYQIDFDVAGPLSSNERNQDLPTANLRTKNAYFQWAGLSKGWDVQIGQFKNPFSFEIPYSASSLEVPERAIVLSQLFPRQTYDRGIKLLGQEGSFRCHIALVNGNGESRWDENRHKDIAARVTYAFPTVTVGASLYRGEAFKDKATDVTKNRFGLDVETNWKAGHFRAEYIRGKDDTIQKRGWYALVRQNLAPSWDIVGRYQEFDPNTSLSGTAAQAAKAGRVTSTTLGFLRYLDKATTLGFWYEWNREEAAHIKNDLLTTQLQVMF